MMMAVVVVVVSNFLVSEASRDFPSSFSGKLCSNITTTLRKPDLTEHWIKRVKERVNDPKNERMIKRARVLSV